MIYCGIGDEAGNSVESQILATRELGWSNIEARNVLIDGHPKANLHDLVPEAFEKAVELLQSSGVQIYCFASTIGNWAKRIEDPFDITVDEVNRAIPRMQRLGTRFVRIMSYKVRDTEDQLEEERFRRLREVTQRFLDAGVQPVHENCMNYGGMSWAHALRLLENVPGLKWVFDTANPVFNLDRSHKLPQPRQDPWEFWTKVRDRVVHIHVKDARWNLARGDADYTWPGEGDGAVWRILRDALARGYDSGISIEPHMVAVFHDSKAAVQDEALRLNYVEYGCRLQRLIQEVRENLN